MLKSKQKITRILAPFDSAVPLYAAGIVLHYLARLLANPGRELHVLDLVAAGKAALYTSRDLVGSPWCLTQEMPASCSMVEFVTGRKSNPLNRTAFALGLTLDPRRFILLQNVDPKV